MRFGPYGNVCLTPLGPVGTTEPGQTCSSRDRYWEMCSANTWYGSSWRAGISRAAYRRSANVLVPYATTIVSPTSEGARDVAGLMQHRHTSPVLSAADANRRKPRERLRYVSGWFCSDPACEFKKLTRPRR